PARAARPAAMNRKAFMDSLICLSAAPRHAAEQRAPRAPRPAAAPGTALFADPGAGGILHILSRRGALHLLGAGDLRHRLDADALLLGGLGIEVTALDIVLLDLGAQASVTARDEAQIAVRLFADDALRLRG